MNICKTIFNIIYSIFSRAGRCIKKHVKAFVDKVKAKFHRPAPPPLVKKNFIRNISRVEKGLEDKEESEPIDIE
jgi:hypothetical protein